MKSPVCPDLRRPPPRRSRGGCRARCRWPAQGGAMSAASDGTVSTSGPDEPGYDPEA